MLGVATIKITQNCRLYMAIYVSKQEHCLLKGKGKKLHLHDARFKLWRLFKLDSLNLPTFVFNYTP